jgi:predicted nucleic acid-binding protein
MYTIDASVWVNGFDQREPDHENSRQLLDLLGTQSTLIVVSNLVLVEVAAAISRTRQRSDQAYAFDIALNNLPNVTVVPLDDIIVHQVLTLAAQPSAETGDLFGLALTPSLRDSPLSMGEGLRVRADTPPFFPEYLF